MTPPARSRSLTATVFTALAPMMLFLIATLGAASYFAAREQILDDVNREVALLAAQSAGQIAHFFQQRREDAAAVSEAPLLHDLIKNLDYGLREEAAAYRGELAAYYSRFAARSGVYDRILYEERGTAPHVSDLELPPLRPDRPIVYAVGVFDEEGRPRGRIELSWRLERLRPILERARVGREGRVSLADVTGREMLVSGPPFEGAILAEFPVAGTALRVRLMARPAEFLGPLQRVLAWIVALSLLAGVLVLVWTGYSVSRAVRPIEEMAEGTKRLAIGDLDYRFETPDIRELRTLGDAFNEMAVRLQERNAELRLRIRSLTALRELEGAVMRRMDEATLLKTCLRAVAEGLSFERVALWWVDPARGEMRGRYLFGTEGMGLTEQTFQTWRVPLSGDDLLNEAVRTGTAFLVKDPAHDPRLKTGYSQKAGSPEFVMAPLSGKDAVFGVLIADNYYGGRPLGESDKEGLSLFANAAGLALENLTLYRNLADSQARYRAVLENSPVAVIGLTQQQWIATWNRGAEELFGYSQAEVLGKPINVLLPSDATLAVARLMAQLVSRGAVREYPMPGRRKDGRLLELSLSWGGAHPDFWSNKEWTVVIRDVTEGRKLQQQLIQSEKLSAVGRLISGIAHELNNPLTALLGFASLAAEGGDPKEDLRLVQENAQRCRKIIDNLLLFVRQGEVRKTAVRVGDAVRASLELLAYKLKKVDVKTRLPARLPRVRGDLQQVEQVIVNLVSNACDAMHDWSGPRRIWVRAAPAGAFVRVELQDSGPGVPEAARPRIFEPFFTTKPEGRGTGLGLATCRQIVHEHGGRIGMESPPEGGALFWVELPFAEGEAARASRKTPEPPRVASAGVLLVDDDAAVRGAFARALREEGHRVEEVGSLEAAFASARRSGFDLVIADVRLGGDSGLELHDAWETRTSRPRPSFLFVTGDVLDPALARTVEGRGLRLLYKPLELLELRRSVRLLLGRKAPRP